MSQVSIYALADPREPKIVRYVGATERSLQERLQEHCSQARRGKGLKDPWVCGLLAHGIRPVAWPIEVCSKVEAGARERFWVSFYKPLGALNLAEGGAGCPGVKPSSLSLSKLIVRNKLPWSESRKQKMRELKTGFCAWTESSKQRYLSSPGWKAQHEARKKAVLCNETGQVFESLTCCARFYKKVPSSILNKIRTGKQLLGLTFSYVSADTT